MAGVVPTEYQESVLLHQWLSVRKIPHFHVPNENGRNGAQRGAMNKRMGVSKGVPDFFVFAPDKNIVIELKRQKGGTVSPEQRQWLETLAKAGFVCAVAHGAKEAIDFIEGELKG